MPIYASNWKQEHLNWILGKANKHPFLTARCCEFKSKALVGFFFLFWKDIYIPFTEVIDPEDSGRAKQPGKKGSEHREASLQKDEC